MAKIIGYFIDRDCEISPSQMFVAIDEGYERVTCYSPIGQHSEGDRGYLDECEEITLDEYIEHSRGIYTPSDYLLGKGAEF